MSQKLETPQVSPSIIADIESVSEGESYIIAYNNDTTPFLAVVCTLEMVVPMCKDEAETQAWTIHFFGSSIIYTGKKSHCERIGAALSKIQVQYDICSKNDN